MKILLTGFTPFGTLETNPTQDIVAALAAGPTVSDTQLILEILPTEYDRAGHRIQALLNAHQPDVYVGLGVAAQRSTVNLERVALNLNDASQADNAGVIRQGNKIIDDAPLAYFSNINLDAVRSHLSTVGHTVTLSNHAGTYVCNHIYFLALHHAHQANMATQCLFIHVPYTSQAQTALEQQPLKDVIDCIGACLQFIGNGNK